MARITLKGNPIETSGTILAKGDISEDFELVKSDLSEVTLIDYTGKRKILNIFPSVDTGTCAASVRRFNQEVSELENIVVLCISKDLPFAQKRFCGAEGIENVDMLSAFRSSFAKDWNLEFTTGGLKGLCSRVIIVLDEENNVLYSQQVPETTEEPNYELALEALLETA